MSRMGFETNPGAKIIAYDRGSRCADLRPQSWQSIPAAGPARSRDKDFYEIQLNTPTKFGEPQCDCLARIAHP